MGKDIKILVTGATGFIGRYLILELLSRGYTNITALVRHTSDVSFLKTNRIKIAFGDITDKISIDSLGDYYEVLFHCAGFVADEDLEALHRVNVLGTQNLCSWALENKLKKVVYTSSVAVNSGNLQTPLTEDKPYLATNRYGESKLEAEKIAVEFQGKGLPLVIVRPCMVYGEGEPHMLSLLVRLLRLRLLILPGLGEPKLHLVSVRNVAAFLAHCMEDERAVAGVFHIADKEVLSLKDIFSIFAKSLELKEPLLLSPFLTKILSFLPFIGKRIRFLSKGRVYSLERIEKILNFIPPYSAYQELRLSVKNFSKKP